MEKAIILLIMKMSLIQLNIKEWTGQNNPMLAVELNLWGLERGIQKF